LIPKRLKEEIEEWMSKGRYGHLQINFSGGKIVNVNRVESLKVEFIGNIAGVTVTSITNDPKVE